MKGDISFSLSVKGLSEAHGASLSESLTQEKAEIRNTPPRSEFSHTPKSPHSTVLVYRGSEVKTNVITVLCGDDIKLGA